MPSGLGLMQVCSLTVMYMYMYMLLSVVVCLTLLASFFLPSHLSLKHVHVCVCMLRNMSAVGGECVCESLVRGDVVTALSALLKEVQYI